MLKTLLRSRLVSVGLAAVIAIGVLGAAGIAMAQTGPDGGGTPTPTSPTGPDLGKHFRGRFIGLGLADIIKVSGLTKDDFQQGFKDGKSINDVLSAHGLNPKDIENKVLQDARAKLDDAVKNNKLTQDQADKLYAGAQQMLEKLMSGTPGNFAPGFGNKGPKSGNGGPVRVLGKGLLDSAAKALNMTTADLTKELQSGKSIKQVADEKGVSVDSVIDAMVAGASANLRQAIENFVDNTHTPPMPHGFMPNGANPNGNPPAPSVN
jgi:hypothetical protein